MTPTEASILYAVALAYEGSADEALAALIEDGLIDVNLHVYSTEWSAARHEAREDLGIDVS